MGSFSTTQANLQPTQNKSLYSGNYINFTSTDHNQWAQQFMPDLYKKIAPIYGSNQSIAGFLKMVTNGEMSSNSDEIIWQEEGRLHTRYTDLASSTVTDGATTSEFALNDVSGAIGDPAYSFPGNYPAASAEGRQSINFRIGQTVMVQRQNGSGPVLKGIVTDVTNATATGSTLNADSDFTVTWYSTLAAADIVGTGDFTALVYGSEFGKGTGNFTEKIDSEYTTYSNSPIIMKEHYAINGSDLSQVGWIDTGEGYLWYHKSKSDNMKRWNDYMEMSLVEGVEADAGKTSAIINRSDYTNSGTHQSPAQLKGTEGFFAALESRGNVYQGFGDEAAGGGALTDFDTLLKQLDKEGSIEENMLYLNRDLSLEIDDILAQQNSYGAGGTSWGAFSNSKEKALDLGFSGFRRGSYDFYKTDWRYLNDFATRGGFSDIEGVLIPAGTSTVYDKIAGNKVKRPFLHVRYKEGRKMKNWITGGAGGATTSDIDELRMHYLTERCLITQGANNFVLFNA